MLYKLMIAVPLWAVVFEVPLRVAERFQGILQRCADRFLMEECARALIPIG
jgi:hypothetical protein